MTRVGFSLGLESPEPQALRILFSIAFKEGHAVLDVSPDSTFLFLLRCTGSLLQPYNR